jgi:hypothetical protein
LWPSNRRSREHEPHKEQDIAGIQIARGTKRFPQIAGRTNDWNMIAIERGRVD